MSQNHQPRAVILFLLFVVAVTAVAQVPMTANLQLQGTVTSSRTPLPGATVTATHTGGSEAVSTITDINGTYSLSLKTSGKYHLTVDMTAFSEEARDLDVTDPSKPTVANFELSLLSRTQRAQIAQRGQRGQRGGVAPEAEPQAGPEDPLAAANPAANVVPTELALPGMSNDAPTESVAVAGNTASPAFGGMFDPERLMQMGLGDAGGRGGNFDGQRGGPGGFGGERGARGGPGGPGFGGRGPGGPGGPGGRGGRGGFILAGQRGRGNLNRPNINFGYTLGDSAFDAAPYALNGVAQSKPEYVQNRFNATIGGPLIIPKIYNGSQHDFFTLSYSGSRVRNPFDAFSTVPTLAERAGDFSQSSVQLINPITRLPFANNVIPSSMFDPAAQGLLAYIPLPDTSGNVQNFHYVTTNKNDSDDLNFRINHTFGARGQRGQGARGGGPRGGGRGFGRGGSALSFGIQLRSQTNVANNAFPSIGGTNTTSGVNVPISFSHSFGRLSTNLNVGYNRNRTSANNLFANQQNIAGNLGIRGVSSDPQDWGLPTLTFTNFSSLNDLRPSIRLNQTFSVGESFGWSRARHNLRFGIDYRDTRLNSHSGTNARGTFTFNGASTGFDFADFLLGMPQLTSVQYGFSTYHFRSNSWGVFLQDDWRVLSRVTLNLGLRYDYISPVSEADGRLVNLDVASDFSAVAPVLPGESGPFSGDYPAALINPDRNNWSPRIGLAWRAFNRTIVRAGYGISYNTNVYASMAQQLAVQPPFSFTQTNIASALLPLTLQNGFPVTGVSTVTNNFGVDKDYRIGYAQTWNVDVQRELPSGLLMNIDYTGTKGTHLDMLQAPNRTASGLRIANVQPFTWETSNANSIANVGRLQLRRRLQHGFSAGGSYTYSKVLDDASSLGGAGGSGTVAQDAFNLAAERSVSNVDQTHSFTGDYLWQLPFGRNRLWLSGDGLLNHLFGDWQLNGAWTFASGLPFTARVIGDASDIRRGTNGTLRADVTGLPVELEHPTIDGWFNTAAFALPLAGTFGNAGRNTIRGPGTHSFDMALNKTFQLKERPVDIRIQATNVFNMPQFRSIDTNVNSPSFGRVTSVGSMRKIQIIARFRY